MDKTIVSVSVSYDSKEREGRIREMFSEMEQLCLSFQSSVELAEFLRSVSTARYAFEVLIKG
jgi:hypothetical protein